jgi:hypothetical protein
LTCENNVVYDSGIRSSRACPKAQVQQLDRSAALAQALQLSRCLTTPPQATSNSKKTVLLGRLEPHMSPINMSCTSPGISITSQCSTKPRMRLKSRRLSRWDTAYCTIPVRLRWQRQCRLYEQCRQAEKSSRLASSSFRFGRLASSWLFRACVLLPTREPTVHGVTTPAAVRNGCGWPARKLAVTI